MTVISCHGSVDRLSTERPQRLLLPPWGLRRKGHGPLLPTSTPHHTVQDFWCGDGSATGGSLSPPVLQVDVTSDMKPDIRDLCVNADADYDMYDAAYDTAAVVNTVVGVAAAAGLLRNSISNCLRASAHLLCAARVAVSLRVYDPPSDPRLDCGVGVSMWEQAIAGTHSCNGWSISPHAWQVWKLSCGCLRCVRVLELLSLCLSSPQQLHF